MRTSNALTLLVVSVGSALLFASCGSGGGSAPGVNGGPAPVVAATPGPLDGTWKLTGILCNGLAATGTATQLITAPNTVTYTIANAFGSFTISSGACAITAGLTASYPAAASVTITPSGTWSCNPAGCAAATCGSAVAPAPLTYSYTRTAFMLSAVVTAGTDQTCTGANPAQPNPVTDIFTKQ